jgi:thymidylate synthase (FAD)
MKPEIARYVLPNACMTEIICTWNFREIRHILKLRTSPAALPEIREVAQKIWDIMKEQAPKVFGDL